MDQSAREGGALGTDKFGCATVLGVVQFAAILVYFQPLLPDWCAWAGGALLVFLGAWATLANWTVLVRKGGGSLIPLFGGLFTAAGVAVLPIRSLNPFWWVAFLVDLGCVPLFLFTTGFHLYRAAFARRDNAPQP